MLLSFVSWLVAWDELIQVWGLGNHPLAFSIKQFCVNFKELLGKIIVSIVLLYFLLR